MYRNKEYNKIFEILSIIKNRVIYNDTNIKNITKIVEHILKKEINFSIQKNNLSILDNNINILNIITVMEYPMSIIIYIYFYVIYENIDIFTT
jgi:hypothetical protein